MTQSGLNDEGVRRLLQQVMDLWVTPEVVRRQENGTAPKPMRIQGAQVLLYPDGRRPVVRLNAEVRAVLEVTLANGVTKNKGDSIHESDISAHNNLTLPDSEDADCGHITVIAIKNTYTIAFDFRYHKGVAKRLLSLASEFIDSATSANSKGHDVVFIDNLFSAAELTSKSWLLVMGGMADKKSHGLTHSMLNKHRQLGNVDSQFTEVFNRLADLRPKARYGREWNKEGFDPGEWLSAITAMHADTTRIIG